MVHRIDRKLTYFLVAILVAVAAYGGGLAGLVSRWSKQEEYSHGFFIPLVSLWLLWDRREALRDSVSESSWLGVGVLTVAVGMLFIGEAAAIYILIQYGFLLAVLGLVICFGGISLARVSVLPIAFLAFAIPLPYFVDSQLSWRMQLLSSAIGVSALQAVGVSVFLEGNLVDLGIYKLQVVEACSGLRYLYPLLSIGFLMAYMYRASYWRRLVLFLSTVPVTILMNSLRIAAVGILVQNWGIEMAEGFMHLFEGWIIFMACLLILLAEVWLFEKTGLCRDVMDALHFPKVVVSKSAERTLNSTRPIVAALGVLFAATAAAYAITNRQELRPPRISLSAFPLVLHDWQATEGHLDARVEEFLGFDDYVLADYRKQDKIINFYVAYYGSQRKGISPHSPEVCIPGGGWLITSLKRVPLSVNGLTMSINRTLIERNGERQLVYYWFEQRGRRMANEYAMKWYLLVDAILHNRSDGALVRITAPLNSAESVEEADARILEFIGLVIPQLPTFVPG